MGARPGNVSQEPLFDTHPESSLDLDIVRESARQRYERPFVILDTAIVREKARRFREAMPRVRPHYAMKANPDPRVIEALRAESVGCEIASSAELDLLTGLGVPAGELYYSNPMKSRQAIAHAAARGVEWFAIDSVDELRRIHEIKADARMYVRISTPNIGADWPLAGKFGAAELGDGEMVGRGAKLGV